MGGEKACDALTVKTNPQIGFSRIFAFKILEHFRSRMKHLESCFSSHYRSLGRVGARGLVLSALVAGSLALSGCNNEAEQLASLTENFQKHLDAKEKELTSLRNSEKELQTQVAELKGRLTEMESEVAASRGKAVDAAAIAKELAPLLTANVRPPEPALMPAASHPTEPAPASPSRSGSGSGKMGNNGVKTTNDGRRQIPLSWDPAAPPAR